MALFIRSDVLSWFFLNIFKKNLVQQRSLIFNSLRVFNLLLALSIRRWQISLKWSNVFKLERVKLLRLILIEKDFHLLNVYWLLSLILCNINLIKRIFDLNVDKFRIWFLIFKLRPRIFDLKSLCHTNILHNLLLILNSEFSFALCFHVSVIASNHFIL